MAFGVFQAITGELPPDPPVDRNKNAHAVAPGRLGSAKGGKARAAKMTAKTENAGCKTTPAMAAGLEAGIWTLKELVERSTQC